MDIQHICEELVTVPVQVDIHNYPTNQHLIPETYHNSYESPQSAHLLSPQHVHDSKDQKQRSQHGFTLPQLDTQLTKAPNQTTDTNYAYDPTPESKFLISPRPKIYNHEISLSVLKTHQRPSRQKRDSEFMNQKFAEEISNDDTLKEIVKQILLTLFDHN